MTELGRVSTYNVFQTTRNNASRAQATLANLQNQLSSGYASQDFAGIADQAAQFLQLNDRLLRVDSYLETNRTVKVRLDTTNTALSQAITTSTQIKNLIQQRQSGTFPSGQSFQQQIENLWQTLVGEINVNVDGRYLFSGSATGQPPVDSEHFPTLNDFDTPDDDYYLGDDQNLAVRADDTISFTYNVRANEPAFQKIFAGLAMARQGDQSGEADQLEQAFQYMNDGIKNLVTVQSRVNSNTVTINDVNQNLSSLKTYWRVIKEDIINTDLVSVSTQVAVNQGILQAAFQSFASITSLRLVDFLR